jgi:hypothetical protein
MRSFFGMSGRLRASTLRERSRGTVNHVEAVNGNAAESRY